MRHTILVLSHDERLLATRELILKSAGYDAHCALDAQAALALAKKAKPDLVVICQTFSPADQSAFIEKLHQANPSVVILAIRSDIISPDRLLTECERLLAPSSDSARVRVFEERYRPTQSP